MHASFVWVSVDGWVLFAALPFEIDFFPWENAVEMFVIYTTSDCFAFCYVYFLQMRFNGFDIDRMNVKKPNQ